MAVTDLFAGEIAAELLKELIAICKKSALCRSSAQELIVYINELQPIIEEIKYSGVELSQPRQRQLDMFSQILCNGLELARKVLSSPRWNVYKNLQLARKMEKLEKNVSRFVKGPMQAHVLADVHHVRYEMSERLDRLEGSTRRLEQRLGVMKIGVNENGWLGEAVKKVEEEERWNEISLVKFGAGIELGKKTVREMLIEKEDVSIVGISGIGGSGKTTLAREIYRDDKIKSKLDLFILCS